MVLHHFCICCRLYRDIIFIVSHNIMWHEFLLLLSLSSLVYIRSWYTETKPRTKWTNAKKRGTTQHLTTCWIRCLFNFYVARKLSSFFFVGRRLLFLLVRHTNIIHSETFLFSSLFIFQNVFVFRMLNERRANIGVCLKWIGLTYHF